MNEEQKLDVKMFDEWLTDASNMAALTMRQWLDPVEGKDAVIFPPTYAKPEGMKDDDWPGYNIDRFDDGTVVCQIDSVGSQANRMEPIFMRDEYKHLIPQVVIKVGERGVHIVEAGHRAGDALVRFAGTMEDGASRERSNSEKKALGERLWDAFKAWQERGDAEPLARIAPTSLVFGAWDSRATQAKVPRIVRSVIRAKNIKRHTRSAQFNTPLHYVDEGLIDEALDKGEGEKNPLSQEGFRHSPAANTHGGIEVVGEIRRDVSLNLVALRALGVTPGKDEEPKSTQERVMTLRRYILGLALVALTHRDGQQFNLREGCLLRVTKASSWTAVPFEGDEQVISIDGMLSIAYANEAARIFGVQQFTARFVFDSAKANRWLNLKKEERDKRRRQGPVVKQDL